jgi:N-glycosylase/DNA lyase
MRQRINVPDFDLAATLDCGQAFRWKRGGDAWYVGVVGREVWRLRQEGHTLEWETDPKPTPNPSKEGNFGLHSKKRNSGLCTKNRDSVIPSSGGAGGGLSEMHITKYLSLDRSLPAIVATFPVDNAPLHAAVRRHWGLRVLRQEPWECLASFIASSSKQIVQIRQIVELLANRFGEPITNADGRARWPQRAEDPRLGEATEPYHSFPSVGVIARASHEHLLACKLGFRAKYLLATARMIDNGDVKLDALRSMEYERALEELVRLPGVGEKIANCVLLFSCGFDEAFPIDVWIERALRRLYFPRKHNVTHRQLREFARSHFGPYAGWAQQCLFFSERMRK